MVKNSSSMWHFLSRLAGLTALVAGIVGAVAWFSFQDEKIGFIIVVSAASVFALSLLPEVFSLLRLGSSQRSAVGLNVAVQVALAAVLVVGVNLFSFYHHERYDCTREHIFTIRDKVRQRLVELKGETDIIVVQQHLSFGQSTGTKQDNYDAAAERKIVEKVKDLVEQFQELGPRFRVQVLDIQEKDYTDKVKAIRQKSPKLADAIANAPENSIFFFANGNVQRLGFQDFYQLDRPASMAADEERGNLILTYQGVEPFADKIFNVEEKKPRIAVATIHPILGLNEDEDERLFLVGAKTVLESHGFDTTDIILKKWFEDREPEATAYTYDESKFEILDDERAQLEEDVEAARKSLKRSSYILEHLKNDSLEKLNQEYVFARVPGEQFYSFLKQQELGQLKNAGRVFETSHVDEKDRQRLLKQFDFVVEQSQLALDETEPALREVLKQLSKLNIDELEEKQHITNVRAKMSRALASCDLLIIPRITLLNIPRRTMVPNAVHALHADQLAAVREFIKAGKPVMFCLGPANSRNARPEDVDSLEADLEKLGFKLPVQTVLFTSETKAFVQPRENIFGSGGGNAATKVEIPAVKFLWDPDALSAWKAGGDRTSTPAATESKKKHEANSLRTSLRTSYRSLGGTKAVEVNLRYPRPVYYFKPRVDPARVSGMVSAFAAPMCIWESQVFWTESASPRFAEENTVLVTSPGAWNEDQPFPTVKPKRIPHYEPPKPTDPGFGTFMERRLGSFPIAAVAEVTLPSEWFPERSEECWVASVVGLGSQPLLAANAVLVKRNEDKVSDRLAVLGSGGIFTGKQLSPLKQKLLLDTCNWLLGRDDLLARDHDTWQYPRVHFSDTSFLLWQWITRAAMPLAFVYIGIVVWLVRRMR